MDEEELEKTMDDKARKKLESRKFLVWLVWLLITVITLGYCIAVILITQEFTEQLATVLEKALGWFFGISMMYIGANAGQKVGFAFADAMNVSKKEGEK